MKSIIEGHNVIHKKTGNMYVRLHANVIDCTNSNDGTEMVLYYRDGQFFVREKSEFNKKFKDSLSEFNK